jgi:hypothetical protein
MGHRGGSELSYESNYASEEQFLAVRFALRGGDPDAAVRISRVIELGKLMQGVLSQFESGERTAKEISETAGSKETLDRIFESILEITNLEATS